MREFLFLVAVLAPVVVLGLLQRSGVEVPTWIRALGLGWFVVGALIIGWYDGWLKRALVGILIFIPLMAIFLWWSDSVPSGLPTAVTILAIAAPIAVLVVLGIATGWFSEVRQDFKRAFGRDPAMRKMPEHKQR